jgi:hypothetical protein
VSDNPNRMWLFDLNTDPLEHNNTISQVCVEWDSEAASQLNLAYQPLRVQQQASLPFPGCRYLANDAYTPTGPRKSLTLFEKWSVNGKVAFVPGSKPTTHPERSGFASAGFVLSQHVHDADEEVCVGGDRDSGECIIDPDLHHTLSTSRHTRNATSSAVKVFSPLVQHCLASTATDLASYEHLHGRLCIMLQSLHEVNNKQSEPSWDAVLQFPVAIDKVPHAREQHSDEFIYWAN